MRRWLVACESLLLLLAACDRTGGGVDERRVEIAAEAFRAIYEAELGDQLEGTYEQVILNAQICGVTVEIPGHPELGETVRAGFGEGSTCQDPFTGDEQAALLATLEELPGAWFTSDPMDVLERIGDGDLGGVGVLLSLGPISPSGGRVEVPASSSGRRSGRFMTLVLRRGDEGWDVTGTTGPVGMA